MIFINYNMWGKMLLESKALVIDCPVEYIHPEAAVPQLSDGSSVTCVIPCRREVVLPD